MGSPSSPQAGRLALASDREHGAAVNTRLLFTLAMGVALLSCSTRSTPPTGADGIRPASGSADTQATRTDRPRPATSQESTATDTGSFKILAVNDIYRISGLLPSERGGLARLRTLRSTLEREHDVLFLHAGDVLFPSLMSREYGGAQMVDVLNLLDGDEASFDPYMAVVPGNHEFDEDGDGDVSLFEDRMRESDFIWLGANVSFPEETRGRPDGTGKERGVDVSRFEGVFRDTQIFERGGMKVGVLGLTMGKEGVAYADFATSRSEILGHANRLTRALREEGAEVVVALTHLPFAVDSMLAADADVGIDLILGGHEHHKIERRINGRWVLKADADAVSASVVTVSRGTRGVSIAHSFETLVPGTYAADPVVHARAVSWQVRFERQFCRDIRQGRYCLDDVMGVLGPGGAVAEETEIRAQGTNVGRTYATLMLEAGEEFRAQAGSPLSKELPMVGIMNSGSLRLNQSFEPGDRWLRRHTEELVQYPEDLWVLGFTTQELKQALDYSVSQRGEGPWLQIAGMEFTANVASGRAQGVKIHGRPLDQVGDSVLVVAGEFLAGLSGGGGRDGFPFRADQNLVEVQAEGHAIQAKDLFREWMEAQGGNVTFHQDTRITVVHPE